MKHFIFLILFSSQTYCLDLDAIHIDSLYNNSVFVGIVKIIEGKYVENFGYKYKAEIVNCLKGDSTKYIEFGEYGAIEIGSKYLIFLSNESENFTDVEIEVIDENGNIISDDSHNINIPGVLYVKYAGFGLMHVEYSTLTNSDAISISTSHIILPDKLKRYQYLIESTNIWSEYQFKKDEILKYLRK